MNEAERRRLKLDSVWDAWTADPAHEQARSQLLAVRADRASEALELLDGLKSTGDPDAFRTALDAWSRKPGYDSFRGFGMMFIHQLVKNTDDPALSAEVLIDALTLPASEAEAAGKIRSAVAHVEQIRTGGYPAPKRTPFVMSLFWSMADHAKWPCLWGSADKVLTSLGWLPTPGDLDQWYMDYRRIVLESGRTPVDVESILWWMHEDDPFTGLDPALLDRCTENVALAEAWKANDSKYPTPDDAATAERNARALTGEARLVGGQLESRVGAALGRTVKSRVLGLKYDGECYRADSLVKWMIGSASDEASLWLWVLETGVAVGLQPGWREQGWTDALRAELVGHIPDGVEFLRFHNRYADRIEPTGDSDPGGQFLVGRFYPGADRLGDVSFADEIEAVAAAVQPVLDRVVQLGGGTSDLAQLAARFVSERPYPNPKDQTQISIRSELAAALTPDALDELDVQTFRQILTTQAYGGPGPQAILNASLNEASSDDLARLGKSLSYLIWDDSEPIARRIDRVLDQGDLGMRGLGESVILKVLSIARPEEFLPAFPYRGDNGKAKLMGLVGLPALDEQAMSAGELQVAANDQLHELLEPIFPGDPWAQAQFLFWLNDRSTDTSEAEVQEVAQAVDLASLNEELFLEPGFLDEVVELLDEKGQVIFYGPPGTGKTYIAKKLAEALAADSSRRMIVQFHPSTSYEDFFEGYRPRTNDDGVMTYELMPGPLARMAELAAKSPSIPHVMVVDEINRANLPKVFGELLFLLEYRDETIQTLYRPDEPFRLPRNLRIIGTMNTADRSIALVDAALRRRFHFVGFFPEQDQMQGLLHRWLEHNDGDPRIAALIEQVNQELVQDVGEHLQIGPSYFMRPGIQEQDLRRIWKYSIEPFVEEQLFGQTEEIKRYGWNEVRQRYWATITADPEDPAILGEEAPEIPVELDDQ